MIEFIFDLFVEVFVDLIFEGFIGEVLLGNEGKPKLKLGIRIFILSVLCLVPSALCFKVSFGNTDEIIVFLGMMFAGLVFAALYVSGLVRMLKNNKKYT